MKKKILWFIIALIFTFCLSKIFSSSNSISSLWLITTAVCLYLLAYRFYSSWIAAKVLTLDYNLPTPAVRFNDGRDYIPTNKWIVFGHHFAAIAGPGPLIGPTLAAQFGYLPGFLWILVGAVIGGCVQDMVILFCSTRKNGKTLIHMAKEELGKIGSFAASLGIIMIMIILIAVLGLVVVNALKHSPWGTATVVSTIPIAMFIGIYLTYLRPGKIIEASIIGLILMIGSVILGKYINNIPAISQIFDRDSLFLAFSIMLYGLAAATLPVWLLLAPRDYLSTFLKLGTIGLLAIAIIILNPELRMPKITHFIDGSGPIFAGKIFPFLFITIACGAISGFHSLIASGTTPKLISSESNIPMIGYGSMILESFVAVMALIAASIQEPGIFFAINSPVGIIGNTAESAIKVINSFGFELNLNTMQDLANKMGETSLFSRTGGAPSLAVGMASIFGKAFGDNLLSIWYHFAIMFEAVFILTTLDAGTRVCRFMLQDLFAKFSPWLGQSNHYPSILITSFIAVGSWGYFLYAGVIDPNGGVNMLWPLFGISNQILAAIALCIATSILIKSGKKKFIFVTLLPLIALTAITSSAAWQKIFSSDSRIGILTIIRNLKQKILTLPLHEQSYKLTSQLIFNQYIVLTLTVIFLLILLVVITDTIIVCFKNIKNQHE